MPLYWRSIEPRLLLPSFVQDVSELLGEDEGEWYVTWGFRSIEESNKLYEEWKAGIGPKAAQGGLSPHNYGLAIDIALDGDPATPRVQPDWNERHPSWIRMRAKVDAHPRLHGGWWFGDGDHIERTRWADYKSWASR